MLNYNHFVKIDEKSRRLVIYRIYGDGRKELFTEIELPSAIIEEREDEFREFARLLGENLLTDSPVARKLLDL
ncbi:MAG: hypothetical protein ABIP04_04580 [Sulfuriferula sp.]